MAKKIFEGLGPGTLVPQRGRLPLPEDDAGPPLGVEEGFVLSRVDGRTSLEEICLLVPFDENVTMVILRRLWEIGAIEVPGVPRVILPKANARTTGKHAAIVEPEAPIVPPPPPAATAARPPPAAAGEGSAGDDKPMSDKMRARVDAFYTRLDQMNAYELLEIDPSADAKAVKRAYFKMSKEFHPDRYFGKDIGEYRDRLSKVFQAVKAAFELLSDENRRRAYEESGAAK